MYDELALDTVGDRKTALFIIGEGAVGLFLYKKIGGGKKFDDLSEKCGYYGEQLVLLAQQLGLNTC